MTAKIHREIELLMYLELRLYRYLNTPHNDPQNNETSLGISN